MASSVTWPTAQLYNRRWAQTRRQPARGLASNLQCGRTTETHPTAAERTGQSVTNKAISRGRGSCEGPIKSSHRAASWPQTHIGGWSSLPAESTESRGDSIRENRKAGKNVREKQAGSKTFQRTEMQGRQDEVSAATHFLCSFLAEQNKAHSLEDIPTLSLTPGA